MRFDVITLFPEMFQILTTWGIAGRAFTAGICQLQCWNPRDFTSNPYRTVDDRPYGGGPGMVMLAEPLESALQSAKAAQKAAGIEEPHVIYLSPQGETLTHTWIKRLVQQPGLILLAGRYEGVDERLIASNVDSELSIGDYVLSGGELPAMVMMDAMIRQLPGVLGDELSAAQDSFVNGLLDYPHYTRPEVYQGQSVPDVLLSGHHANIERWRLKQALGRTWQRRPDLLLKRELSAIEARLLEEFKHEILQEGNQHEHH